MIFRGFPWGLPWSNSCLNLNHNSAASLSTSDKIHGFTDLFQRKCFYNRGLDQPLSHHDKRVRGILLRTIPGADNLQFPLRNLNGIDLWKLCVLPYHDDLSSA